MFWNGACATPSIGWQEKREKRGPPGRRYPFWTAVSLRPACPGPGELGYGAAREDPRRRKKARTARPAGEVRPGPRERTPRSWRAQRGACSPWQARACMPSAGWSAKTASATTSLQPWVHVMHVVCVSTAFLQTPDIADDATIADELPPKLI